MTEDINKDLFNISLTETGIYYIKRLAKLSGFVLFASVVVFVTLILLEIREIKVLNGYEGHLRGWQVFRFKIYPWLTLVGAAANIFGIYYYVKFLRTMNRSIETSDQLSFNNSFKYAFRNIVIFMGVIFLTLVMNLMMLISL